MNVLLVQLRQIGDVLLTTPVARAIKAAHPNWRVSFLTEQPSDQLLAGNPDVDEIILNERRGGWRSTLRLAGDLRRRRFDVVVDAMANPRSALLAFLSRAPVRISYSVRGRGVAYTHRVSPSGRYPSEIKGSLLKPLGVTLTDRKPRMHLSSAERAWGRDFRKRILTGSSARLITIDPTHRRVTRRWPAPHYGELCRRLAVAGDGSPVVLWGPGEEGVAREVCETSGGAARMAPPTRLRELAALIAAADLHVGNCSAPRHMAVAVGTPSFTVLGSTSAGWTFPSPEHSQISQGLECQPCNRNTCDRDVACLTGLAPERVYDVLREWTSRCLGWRGA